MAEPHDAAIRREDAELHKEMDNLKLVDLTGWRAFATKLVALHAEGKLRYGVWDRFMNSCPKAAPDARQKVRSAFTGGRSRHRRTGLSDRKPNERQVIPDWKYKDH